MYCQARRGCLAIEGLSEKSKEAFVSRQVNLAAHRLVNKGDNHPDESGVVKKPFSCFLFWFLLMKN